MCITDGEAGILGQSLLAGYKKFWFYFFSANKEFKPQRNPRAQSCFFIFVALKLGVRDFHFLKPADSRIPRIPEYLLWKLLKIKVMMLTIAQNGN